MFNFFRFMLPRFDVDTGGSGGGTSSELSAPTTSTPAPASSAPIVPAASSSEPAQPVAQPDKPAAMQNPLRTGQSFATQTNQPIVPAIPVATPAQPVASEPVIEELDWAGRKVKVTDPVIKDLHKDYSSLNGEYTRSQQRVRDLEDQIQKATTSAQPVAPQASVQPQQAAPDPVRLKEINEKYLEMVYEDPIGANVWLNQQPEYQQMIRPIQQQHMESYLTDTQKKEQERTQRVTDVRPTLEGKYTDYRQMLPVMQEVVNRFPHLAQQIVDNPTSEVFESVYWMAKGTSGITKDDPTSPEQQIPQQPVPVQNAQPVAPTSQPVTAEQLLADPNFIKQIIANPQIQQSIISNYVNGVNNGQSQMPVMIGNQPGGQAPSAPDFQPKNIREAGKAFRSWTNRANPG